MGAKRQIWYVEGSAAEKLAAPLGSAYELREIDRRTLEEAKRARGKAKPHGAAIWMAELEAGGGAVRLPRGGDDWRVIGIVPAKFHAKPHIASVLPQRPGQVGRKGRRVFAYLSAEAPPGVVERTVETAFENLELKKRERHTRRALLAADRELEKLNEIGVALSAEKDVSMLLRLILEKAREITLADAGSLYLVEEDADGQKSLRFVLTQNDSLDFPFQEVTMPMTENSLAGYTALRGEALNFADAYRISKKRPFHFNDRYDRESGYKTQSLLTLPMKNPKGEVLGVLQLINCKRKKRAVLRNDRERSRYVQAFPARSVRLGLSLASQAAVAWENRRLYQEVEALFEGFVRASVTAIEQRDPTTSGHSLRVAAYTENLAKAVDRETSGTYAGTRFTPEQLKEIRYAALLHDFGKVGVREEVLVKAKKLYPLQLQVVRQRFDYIRKEIEASTVRRKLQVLLERDRGDALSEVARLSEDLEQREARINEYLNRILEANEPALMDHRRSEELLEIARQYFEDPRGVEAPYLNSDELRLLSIPRGSLDAAERREIESHVQHTFNFLSQIPWTKELRGVPEIAKAHHEKINGTGYPNRLKGDEIPLPAKMMTICDIYDALTAADRPYKKAVAPGRALEILAECARDAEVEEALFRIFQAARVYESDPASREFD
ncbi:MAG TPA: HD domain-containing phosphohydrolase [Verrucomicrobiae bacterium]|nr:HD domain-containing phosphohydrolase [Verrucomicrobiae bacterium]